MQFSPASGSAVKPPPKRQSCDRCHSQKLRCARSDRVGTAGACDRCVRKGVHCVYSHSLAKGRPPLNQGGGGDDSTTQKTPTQQKTLRRFPPTLSTCSSTVTGPNNQHITPITPSLPGPTAPPPSDRNVLTPASRAASMDAFTDLSASLWPEDHMASHMVGVVPLHMGLPTTEGQGLSGLGFSGISIHPSVGGGRYPARENTRAPETDFAEIIRSRSRSNQGHLSTTPESGFELSIRHLSRLSTRLSRLLTSSKGFLADALGAFHRSEDPDPALHVQKGVEIVFKSVNSWLMHGLSEVDAAPSLDVGADNASSLLRHVFSITKHLLEVLQHVRGTEVTSDTCSSTAGSSPLASNFSSVSAVDTAASWPSNEGAHSSYSVVYHLMLACVTLLLNIYVTILTALQQSADILNSSLRRPGRSLLEPSDHTDALQRARFQLISVEQLCAYFLKHHNQAVDMVTLSSQSHLHTPLSWEVDVMSDLKHQTEQRLRRLQESLDIMS